MSEVFFSLAIRNGYWELPKEETIGKMVFGAVLEESTRIMQEHELESVCFPSDWFNKYAFSLRQALEPINGLIMSNNKPSSVWTIEDRVFLVLRIISKIETASKIMPKGSDLALHYWYMRRKGWFMDLLIGIRLLLSKPEDFLEENREKVLSGIVDCPVSTI